MGSRAYYAIGQGGTYISVNHKGLKRVILAIVNISLALELVCIRIFSILRSKGLVSISVSDRNLLSCDISACALLGQINNEY